MAQARRKRWVVQKDAMDGSLQAKWGCHATIVLISPTQQEFYMG